MSDLVLQNGVYIHPTAEVEKGAKVGAGTKIWHLCHVREDAVIGENCSLGRNVFVDSGVIIGNGVRVQNNVSIYRGVVIEDFVFIGPHVVFTNDKFPRAFPIPGGWKVSQTLIKHGASLGAGTVVVCGNTVGELAMVGAGSVVCRDINPCELVYRFSIHKEYLDKEGFPKC